MGLNRCRVPLCGPWRWRGMPSANTLPAVTSRAAAAMPSGVMWLSVPISSCGPQRPQLRTCSAIVRRVSSLMPPLSHTRGRIGRRTQRWYDPPVPPPSALAPAPTPRFAALHIPDYRRYFVTALLAMTADSIEHVISYWVIFLKFHSPTLAGFAVISHWVPFLLFSFYAGALAD